jgi:hypothetical protein
VYDRRVNNKILTFGHSGRLYEKSFVLYDKQTNSQWVHVTGEAKAGFYNGEKLTFIPSTVMAWSDWYEMYPMTKVLPGYGRQGFKGTFRAFNDIQTIGLVVSEFNISRLYPFSVLKEIVLLNDEFNGKPIVVVYDHDRLTANAWERRINGRIVDFIPVTDAQNRLYIKDRDSDQVWDPLSGIQLFSKDASNNLIRVAHNPILIDRYLVHYPDGQIVLFPED